MIYFIECQAPDHRPIKIGYTRDLASLKKRMFTLQTSSPWPLELRGVIRGGVEAEKNLHKVFADQRLRGEWFVPTAALVRRLDRLSEKLPTL